MIVSGLSFAASVLEAQAEGRAPDRTHLIVGALALDALMRNGGANRDIFDAAADLKMLAEGGALDLDESGRARAAQLAKAVRKVAQVTA